MVIWSDLARDDLRKIHDYIATDSRYYAKKVVHTILESTDNLEQFPEMGRIVPEIGDSHIREIILYSYRIIYELHRDTPHILTIIHGKQDFAKDRTLQLNDK